jgi:hypothetical protein
MGEIRIEFTDKEITPWGGMVLMKKMLDRIRFSEVMESCEALPRPGSNRGYDVTTVIEAFMVSVWCGANRFLHTEITRHDNPLVRIFGWRQAPGQDVYKRFFGKFTQATNQHVFGYLYRWFFRQLRFDDYTLDFDSTVITRYGNQEGAKRGYNPKKPGRRSHHPLIAFVADVNMVANMWLRSGDSHTSCNLIGFLHNTLEHLEGKRVRLLRLDSGFYQKEVFDYLEANELNYIVAAKLYTPLQRVLYTHPTWLKLDEGIEIASTDYQSPTWDRPRRLVMVRQEIEKRPNATGRQLRLFTDEALYKNYRYSAFITNIDLPATEVWRIYRNRANAENRIKELKYDFGFDSFNLHNFFGTEAALNFVMLAYNLMSLFRQFILNSRTQQRLSTLRLQVYNIGAYLIRDGRHIVLKLSLRLKQREWFSGIWDTTKNFTLPVYFSNA